MGVVVLEERPFTVTRADGMPVWIYQFKISPHPSIPEEAGRRRARGHRHAVRRRGHRDLAGPRRDRPVQRTGAARRPDLAAGRRPAQLREVPAAGRFPYSQSHIETVVNDNAGHGAVAGRAVRGAVRSGGRAVGSDDEARRAGGRRRGRRRHRRTGQPGHRPGAARVRVDDPGDAAHQLLRHPPGFGPRARTCCRSSSIPV